MPTYSSMWNAVTRVQSTSVRVDELGEERELRVAGREHDVRGAALVDRASAIAAAASAARPRASVATSSKTRTSSSLDA